MFSVIPRTLSFLGRCILPRSLFGSDTVEKNDAPGKFASLECGDTHYIYKDPTDFPPDKRQELVVLLHGASVYSFIWDRFANWFLNRGHPILSFDFYGHGFSELNQESSSFSIDLFCLQMERLLEHLNITDSHGSFILIGHSMGGLIASKFTSKHKNMVSRLILLNCAGIEVPKSLKNALPSTLRVLQEIIRKSSCLDMSIHFIAKILSLHGGFSKLTHDQISELAMALDEETKEKPKDIIVDSKYSHQIIIDRLMNYVPDDAIRLTKSLSFLYYSWIYQCSLSNRARVLLEVLRGCILLDGDYTKTFSMIDIPTLIIWGESDCLLPKFMASDMREFMPHAEILYVNGDHAAFLQKPMETFTAIVNFVEYGTLQAVQNV